MILLFLFFIIISNWMYELIVIGYSLYLLENVFLIYLNLILNKLIE